MQYKDVDKVSSKCSLIMTVLNEEASIKPFLKSVAYQDQLPNEVVVVDGGSTDNTVALIAEWAEDHQIAVNLIVSKGASISEGRNLAAASAVHDVLAITDAGTTLSENWLSELCKAIDQGCDMAAGFFEPDGRTRFELILSCVITPHVREINPEKFLPSSRSVAVKKEFFIRSGGYPEWLDYCEDLVFDQNVLALGAKKSFVPDAIAYWTARSNLKSYAKQYFRYARGDGRANLFFKRHVLRYFTYLILAVSFLPVQHRVKVRLVSLAILSVHFSKFTLRVWSFREKLGRSTFIGILAATPIVALGDLSKMIGYPVGIATRNHVRKGL